jgi:hypothetical protein
VNDEGQKYTFSCSGCGDEITMTTERETLDDVLDFVKNFLQACGFYIEPNKTIELVNECDIILSPEEFEELKTKAERIPRSEIDTSRLATNYALEGQVYDHVTGEFRSVETDGNSEPIIEELPRGKLLRGKSGVRKAKRLLGELPISFTGKDALDALAKTAKRLDKPKKKKK